MSTELVLPDPSSPEVQTASTPSSASARPPRTISCLLCQQRKIRCDRKYPCSNCMKARVECKAATAAPRRRRRRHPEMDLLNKLRKYEDLLHKQGIDFEPFLKDSPLANIKPPYAPDDSQFKDEHCRIARSSSSNLDPSTPENEKQIFDPAGGRTFWKAMDQAFRDDEAPGDSSDEEIVESNIQSAWDQLYDNNDHIFFGSGTTPKNLISLHPEPVHIFRLWQIYLDNVNPILKITHAPTQQQQIIEASSNLSEVNPEFEAFMFGIYCAAISSLTDEECLNIFGKDSDTLKLRYQSGCQQALVNAGFLRTFDMRVLVALFLYLLSIRQNTNPRSLSSMIALAVRIAQRLGLHAESCNKEFSPFEAEMRRRLWWQIVILDSRIGELANYKASILTPTWDCNMPLNISDSDMFPHLKKLPTPREGLTESLFIVLQCEIADFVRYAQFHLDFVSPFLKSLAKDANSGQPHSVDELEEMIENKYLKHCDPQVPLQFLSSCMSRSLVGKWRLAEYLSETSNNPDAQPPAYREKIFSNVVHMIEVDTMVQTSRHVKGFRWLTDFHFPFPAYVYLVHELRRRTMGALVDQAWEAMAVNFETRNLVSVLFKSLQYRSFSQNLLKAWDARQSALEERGEDPTPREFISKIRALIAAGKGFGPTQPSPYDQDAATTASSGMYAVMQRPADSDIYLGSTRESTGTDLTGLEADVDLLGFGLLDWTFPGNMMGGSSSYPGGPFGNGTQGMESTTFENWMMSSRQLE